MHIMVSKRYIRKYDTCVGHEARINKLLLKKPPGITSASKAQISPQEVCAEERGGKRRENKDSEKYERLTEEGDEP